MSEQAADSQASPLKNAVRALRARRAVLKSLFDLELTSYYLLVGAVLLLLGIGLLEVFSASSVNNLVNGRPMLSSIQNQAISAVLGLALMWGASRLPPRAYRTLAYPALVGTVLALLLVLAVGSSHNGNKNWLIIGPLTVQPSEFAKLALVLWGADLLVRKEKLLTTWDHLLVPLVPGAVVIIALVMMGGDMGTSIIIVAIVFCLLFTAGAPGRLFSILLCSAVGLATLAILMRPSRVRRFTNFLSPENDPGGTGYQAIHAFQALASGGWFGEGLGASKQRWGQLPEVQTDMIFAIIGEELGLIGALTVLGLFLTLAYAGIRMALRTTDPFVRLVSASVTVWLAAQMMINLGAVTGVLPIAGVPLPFVSYGGSSLLPSLTAVGMLMSFARRRPEPLDPAGADAGSSAGASGNGGSSGGASAGSNTSPDTVRDRGVTSERPESAPADR
ncbi:putative lipid II flippase FtsW [Catenulispora pinistramenti]|uniref:putative lipid II flippase FtsW n=1 Tax=Catenulispora pinistramenti TaxID=2705254 RepID=UPI001E500F5B|nr:putative lipid II flippase FtsW [Catenulispora pinistramenti]